MKRFICLSLVLTLGMAQSVNAQENSSEKSIAIVSIDTKGLSLDNLSMGNLVRIELEKLEKFEVLDKYDAANVMKQNGIQPENCFGKTQLVDVGLILKADFMLSGSAEKFGEKIIFILRLVNVAQRKIERTSVMEYIYQEDDIQVMARVSLNGLFDIPNDPDILNLLVNIDQPLTSNKTTLTLNGPRFGMNFFTGEIAKRLEAPESQGGYNSVAYGSLFGYQHEIQYVSKGNFQALFEFIGTVNNIETNHASFSLTVLNGLRYNGWEFGFGPAFRFAKFAEGYYNTSGEWVLKSDIPEGEKHDTFKNLDSRGDTQLNAGLIIAAGKTFSVGYLNLPVNFYWSPSSQLEANTFGIMLGFNVAKKQKK